MKVTVQEIIDCLQDAVDFCLPTGEPYALTTYEVMRERIQQHGIEVGYTPMTEGGLHGVWFSNDGLTTTEKLRKMEQSFIAHLGVAPTLEQAKVFHFSGTPAEMLAQVNSHTQAAPPEIQQRMDLIQAKAICEQAGFAVVPKEPTEAMINVMHNYDIYSSEPDGEYNGEPTWSSNLIQKGIYKAMLEAAKEVK
jgi:hypothetical protein